MMRFDKNFFVLFILVLIIFLAASVYYYHKTVQDGKDISWVDFRVYYYAGFGMEAGTNIYDLNDGYFIYKYSPIFALIMSVIRFSNVTLADALAVWYIILFASFLVSIFIIKEILIGPRGFFKFRFFDIIPLLFVFRYLILINFTKGYIITHWPSWVQVCDKFLLYFLTPLYFLSFLFITDRRLDKKSFGIVVLAIFSILPFILLNIDRAQVNIVISMLVLFFIYYLSLNKDILAGLYLGIAIVFKLYPLIFLIYLITKKRLKAFFTSIITVATLIFIPCFKLGLERNLALIKNWVGILRMTFPTERLEYRNQSLLAAMSRFFSSSSDIAIEAFNNFFLAILIILIYLILMVILVYVIKESRPNSANKDALVFDTSLFMIAMILLSPLSPKMAFIYLLFPIAVIIKEIFKRRFKDVLLNVGMLSCVILTYASSPDILGEFSVTLHKYSIMTFYLLLLFGMVVYSKFSISKA